MTRIELSPELRATLEGTRELVRRMRPMGEFAALAASLMPLARLAQAFRHLVESGWFAKIHQGLTRLAEAMSNAEAVGRAGWTVPLNVDIGDCLRLLRVATTPEAADAAFVEFYVANGKESLMLLLADLQQQPKLGDFRAPLQDVAFAIDNEKYRLAVPTLLTVLEGVARLCWDDRDWGLPGWKTFFNQKLTKLEVGSFERVAWTATKALFCDGLYATNRASDPKPQMLNRNWILHGRGPADNSLADCLRLLQAIHTLLTFAEEDWGMSRVSAAWVSSVS